MQKIALAIALAALATLSVAGQAIAATMYSVTDLGAYHQNLSLNDAGSVFSPYYVWENGTQTPIGVNPSNWSDWTDINNQGQAVFGDILWDNGKVTKWSSQGQYLAAEGINDKGTVVGRFGQSENDSGHAFKLENGTITDQGTLGGRVSAAWGINNAGQIVGVASHSDGSQSAVLWENGKMIDLGIRGAAMDINNQSQIIGNYANSIEQDRAFLWENGKMVDIGSLGGDITSRTFAKAINDAGQIVGASETEEDVGAFIWEKGQMLNLNSSIAKNSGWQLMYAEDINNKGQIVGWGNLNGALHGFLLNPVSNQPEPRGVPEPTGTWELLVFGMLGASFVRKRHQQKVQNNCKLG